MADSLAAPASVSSILPPVCNYIAYFFRPKSDPFTNVYAGCLATYVVNTENPTAAKSTAEISKEIYAVATEGILTAYLLWHPTVHVMAEGVDPGWVALLHTVSQFPTRLGHPPMQLDNHAFNSKVNVVVGMIAVADWDDNNTNQIHVAQCMPTAFSIETALAAD